ncbi:hypothetical protein Hte_005880 [Hypoxylon texense]
MIEKRRFERPTLPPVGEQVKLLRHIDIYHPGYPGMKPLLSFNSSDNGGVDYTIVYYACCIVAGNIWNDSEGRNHTKKHRNRTKDDPYLSKTMKQVPMPIPDDDIIPPGHYFFHVPKIACYPFYPNFDQWVFPEQIPKPWAYLQSRHEEDEPGTDNGRYAEPSSEELLSEPPSGRDFPAEPCRITGHPCGIELGHVVPKTVPEWFNINYMRDYSTSSSEHNDPLNDIENLIPIRKDLHHLFDHSNLVIVPKRDRSRDTGALLDTYSLLTHVLQPPGKSRGGDLMVLNQYHNLDCYPIKRVPMEYFFARFAWSLFNDKVILLLKDESAERTRFKLLLTKLTNQGWETKETSIVGTEYRPRSGTRSTKNQGSNKRRRGASQDKDASTTNGTGSVDCDDSSGSDDSDLYDKLFDNMMADLLPSNSHDVNLDDDTNTSYDEEPPIKRAKQNPIPLPPYIETEDSPCHLDYGDNVDVASSVGSLPVSESAMSASSEFNFDFNFGNKRTMKLAPRAKADQRLVHGNRYDILRTW